MSACPRCGAPNPSARLGVCPRCMLAPDPPPMEVEGLEIGEEIGRGGMGSVYRARHVRLGRTVAVKFLPAELAERGEFVARFEREGKALAMLSHPNIVAVYECGPSWIVMEHVKGRSLAQALPLPAERAADVIARVCDALEYAHGRGIVHRDVKPANILLADDGAVKVTDFGIARLVSPDTPGWTVTTPDVVLGTPHYMSPEALKGARPDPRMDVYSLGVVLYETLTGRLPLGDFAPAPAPFDRVVRRALAPEPAARYASIAEMRRDLERLPPADALPPEERAWRRAGALALTVATAIAFYALVECTRPRILDPGDVHPLSVSQPERLSDGRLVSRARFEIWPILAAVLAAAAAMTGWGFLSRHWRQNGLDREAPDKPLAEAKPLIWFGVASIALWAVRRGLEVLATSTFFPGKVVADGAQSLIPYVVIAGGALEVGMLFFLWTAILEAWRVSRPVLKEHTMWAGVVLALVPPVVEMVRYMREWKP